MRTLLRTTAIAVLFALPALLSAQTTRTVLLEQMTGLSPRHQRMSSSIRQMSGPVKECSHLLANQA